MRECSALGESEGVVAVMFGLGNSHQKLAFFRTSVKPLRFELVGGNSAQAVRCTGKQITARQMLSSF
jgi:hypothetical protein